MMSKLKKNNAKSVRMTDEVLACVQSQEGEGFNQQFENMVLFAMKTEKDRQKRIVRLDEEIRIKSDMLVTLRNIDNELSFLKRQLNGFADRVQNLVNIDNR